MKLPQEFGTVRTTADVCSHLRIIRDLNDRRTEKAGINMGAEERSNFKAIEAANAQALQTLLMGQYAIISLLEKLVDKDGE